MNSLIILWEPIFFITKFYYQQQRLEKILEVTQESNKKLKQQALGFSNIIGINHGLSGIAKEIRKIAPFDISVLIEGETGTGKDLFASEIHKLSTRNGKPFIAVNCGGITSSLINSELFGYDKGAFTGAYKDYKGRFERANGGTIFLDEIGELPLDGQTRLLRVIQNRTVERVGGSTLIPVDFRLVCATNKDLAAMVRTGTFREDLYFRIAGVRIRIPPLRERPSDIPLLVQHVLNREAARYGVPPPLIAEGEMLRLLDYPWPGNVRELINVVMEGFVRSLPDSPVVFRLENMREKEMIKNIQRKEEKRSYDEVQREYFENLLQSCGGKISGPHGVAARADINSNTLRAKLRKLGISFGRR